MGRTTIPKEWAAVEGDEIVEKAETEDQLRRSLRRQGLDPDDYEIVALPKSHRGFWI